MHMWFRAQCTKNGFYFKVICTTYEMFFIEQKNIRVKLSRKCVKEKDNFYSCQLLLYQTVNFSCYQDYLKSLEKPVLNMQYRAVGTKGGQRPTQISEDIKVKPVPSTDIFVCLFWSGVRSLWLSCRLQVAVLHGGSCSNPKEGCNRGVACSLLKLGSLEKTVKASLFLSGLHSGSI